MTLHLPNPPPDYDQRTENVRNRALEAEDTRNAKLQSDVFFGNVRIARSTNAAGSELVRGDDTRLSGSGTVTSVGLTVPGELSVGGTNPIITSGTFVLSWVSQARRLAFMSPVAAAGAPSFRAINSVDLPASGVTAATYGPYWTATVDSTGRITAAATVPLQPWQSFFSGVNGGVGGNTISNTAVVTSFSLTYSVPAGTITIGSHLDIKACGHLSTTAVAPTVQFSITVNGVVIVTTPVFALAVSLVQQGWRIEATLICTAANTFEIQGMAYLPGAAGAFSPFVIRNLATVGVTVSSAAPILVRVLWGTANAGNTATIRQLTVDGSII